MASTLTDPSSVRSRGLISALLRDVSGLWGAEGATLAAFLVQGLLVARWLGPRAVGVAALAMAYPAFVFTFFDLRAIDATTRFLGEFHARGDGPRARGMCHFGFLADAASGAVTLVFVVATARWAQDHVVRSPHATGLVVVYAVALFSRFPAGTSKSSLAIFGRFRSLATAQTVNALLRSSLILALVVRGWGVNAIVAGSALALPADAALTYALARPLRRRHWGIGSLGASWAALAGRRREIVGFTLWSDLGGMFGVLAKQADVLILGLFRAPAAVGYYSLAESGAGIAGNIVSPLQSVVYPRLARRRGGGGEAALWDDLRAYALRVGLPLAAVSMLLLPLVPLGIRLTVGGRYLPAVASARLLIAGGALWLGFFWMRPALLTLGAARWLALFSGATAGITLLGMFALAPRFGPVGVAAVQVLVGAGGNLVCLRYLAAARRAALSGGTR